jgi:hypothetical protein
MIADGFAAQLSVLVSSTALYNPATRELLVTCARAQCVHAGRFTHLVCYVNDTPSPH